MTKKYEIKFKNWGDQTIVVFLGPSIAEITRNEDFFKKSNILIEEYSTPATTLLLEDKKAQSSCIAVLLEATHEDIDEIVVHECVHAIAYLMDYVGVEFDPNNHEAYAYSIGYLYSEIKKKHKKFIKKYNKQ